MPAAISRKYGRSRNALYYSLLFVLVVSITYIILNVIIFDMITSYIITRPEFAQGSMITLMNYVYLFVYIFITPYLILIIIPVITALFLRGTGGRIYPFGRIFLVIMLSFIAAVIIHILSFELYISVHLDDLIYELRNAKPDTPAGVIINGIQLEILENLRTEPEPNAVLLKLIYYVSVKISGSGPFMITADIWLIMVYFSLFFIIFSVLLLKPCECTVGKTVRRCSRNELAVAFFVTCFIIMPFINAVQIFRLSITNAVIWNEYYAEPYKSNIDNAVQTDIINDSAVISILNTNATVIYKMGFNMSVNPEPGLILIKNYTFREKKKINTVGFDDFWLLSNLTYNGTFGPGHGFIPENQTDFWNNMILSVFVYDTDTLTGRGYLISNTASEGPEDTVNITVRGYEIEAYILNMSGFFDPSDGYMKIRAKPGTVFPIPYEYAFTGLGGDSEIFEGGYVYDTLIMSFHNLFGYFDFEFNGADGIAVYLELKNGLDADFNDDGINESLKFTEINIFTGYVENLDDAVASILRFDIIYIIFCTAGLVTASILNEKPVCTVRTKPAAKPKKRH